MLLAPAYRDYLWGGTKLEKKWGKTPPEPGAVIAETWELSLREGALCGIKNGRFAGLTLLEVLEFNPGFAGKKCLSFSKFPLLIKLIDSAANLSVQVHPSDAYALVNEKSYGKSEVWFILEAEENAGVFFGFKRDSSEAEVRDRINDGSLTEILNFTKVKAGDVFMIDAGTVHAVGGGITLAEIQQNSDLTYRVYDFGRTDKNGKPRELHIEKALTAMNFRAHTGEASVYPYVDYAEFQKRLIADNKYFFSEFYRLDGACPLCNEDCFTVLTLTAERADIRYGGESLSVVKGDTVFIPAGLEISASGKAEFIATTLR
ncbi:MAG: class I mannose-6-phosphate isomerase [Clostridiales bacterium]|nr:class I mannose-6-phosphate isomerase [Clostridiales bacterium]